MKTSNFETAFITHDDNDGDTNQALCVAQDSQGDVYLWTEGVTATQSLRYREPVLGGGLFPNTREALIQLIEAIKKDENQKEKSINQNIISGLNSIYKFTKEVEKLLEEEKTQNKNFYGKFYFMLKDCFDSNIYNFYNVKKEAKDVIIDSKLYRNKTFYTTEEYNSKYTFIFEELEKLYNTILKKVESDIKFKIEDYKEDILHIQDTLINNEEFKKYIEI